MTVRYDAAPTGSHDTAGNAGATVGLGSRLVRTGMHRTTLWMQPRTLVSGITGLSDSEFRVADTKPER